MDQLRLLNLQSFQTLLEILPTTESLLESEGWRDAATLECWGFLLLLRNCSKTCPMASALVWSLSLCSIVI